MNFSRNSMLILALVLIAFSIYACDFVTLELPQEVKICQSDGGKQINVRVGELIAVALESNPSTGFIWKWDEPESEIPGILMLAHEPETSSISKVPGAPAITTFSFRVTRAGSELLKLIYHRPFESEVEPAESFEAFIVATYGEPRSNEERARDTCNTIEFSEYRGFYLIDEKML
jgi:inhibitor of cysteine peptidase